LPAEDDVGGVAAEGGEVGAQPLEGEALVAEAEVGDILVGGGGGGGGGGEAEDVEAVAVCVSVKIGAMG
jgi:hypothetical protein